MGARKVGVTSGTMSSATKGVVNNLHGVVGVLERAVAMRPEVVFLISDASFQWRPPDGWTRQRAL